MKVMLRGVTECNGALLARGRDEILYFSPRAMSK